MSNLAIMQPPSPLAEARLIQIRVEEPPESLSAFMAMPRSGGVLLGVPSRDHGRFHYHFLGKRAPGSTAWRLVLLRTWEPRDGSPKRHEVVWETPPISEADLKRWASAIVHRLQGIELLGTLQAAGFGLATLQSLEEQAWIPFSMFSALFRRMRTEKRLLITNRDLVPPAPRSSDELPDVLVLPSAVEDEEIRGLAFRLLRKPEAEIAEYFGVKHSDAAGAGPFYLFVRMSMLPWIAEVMVDTALEALTDRGLRERLREIQTAIAAARRGAKVDWPALLTY